MKAFLEKIAERLVKKFPDSMENIAIVLPSKRSVIFLKHHLSKLIDKPIFLPKFFSIEEFIEELSEYRVVDNLSLQFYLYHSYLETPPSQIDTFEKFMSWSSMLLHDFNEIDRSLIDAKSVFTNLKQVKELENWTLDDWSFNSENLTDSQEQYVSFYNQFYNWYMSFNKILSDKKLSYQGMAKHSVGVMIFHLMLKIKNSIMFIREKIGILFQTIILCGEILKNLCQSGAVLNLYYAKYMVLQLVAALI